MNISAAPAAIFDAINWNRLEDPFSKAFWDQNVRQFWVDEEIPLADDKLAWMALSATEQQTFERVLGGLTLLDTVQGGVGMPTLARFAPHPHQGAVMGFMGAMEHMHAKSYSSIFTTLSNRERIEETFAWVREEPALQAKLEFVQARYNAIRDPSSLYVALATSVLLESFLFYSGFFYPLFLAGQGKMTSSGEIINLIVRDESVHGVFVGLVAQQVHAQLNPREQARAHDEVNRCLTELLALEERYTHAVYAELGLVEEVLTFAQYNADKALMNLGLEPAFGVSHERVNPVVLGGLRTETRNHDFFSMKGNGYIKTTRVEGLRDEDFVFASSSLRVGA
jgi:ribonucleoside-diphosphate reductase beta chain